MIKSFKNKSTKALYEGLCGLKWHSICSQAERRLQLLDSATCLQDLYSLPSNHLERLSGDRNGQYSIRLNKQWRICFRWIDNEAHDVEIVDYHRG